MKKIKTNIPFNYLTIKTTKSRIDKGLLSIPVSLIDYFPKQTENIFLIDENGCEEIKTFTQYESSSRECRIDGLSNFYKRFDVKDGDELVIQFLDDNKIRLFPEYYFKDTILLSLNNFGNSIDEEEIKYRLDSISKLSNTHQDEVIKNEFVRLSIEQIPERKIHIANQVISSEAVSPSLRKILMNLYQGKCQISNFTFLMKNNKPYFEIHHINPLKGNHFKNLLVVSPNVHAQFTYARLEQIFDDEGWLRKVKFNNDSFHVYQAIDDLPRYFEKEVHTEF
jgi:hypothetical protein